jgi:O-antigen/teichoic acid export membrane protein
MQREHRAPLKGAAVVSAAAALSSRAASLVVVPFALRGLGADLYGTWVVATVVASSQGLVDLGARAALVRYTAMGLAEDDPAAIRRTLRLVGIPYGVLSVVFIAAALPLTGHAVGWFHVSSSEHDEAQLLLVSGVVTFALLNLQSIAVGLLSGLQKATTAYFAVTVGNIAYVGVAVGGYFAGRSVAAMVVCGPAMLLTQLAILGGPTRSALVALRSRAGPAAPKRMIPRRELFTFSLGMQLVTLADFAVLQLPRVIGAAALGAGAIVRLDIALRVGAVVAGIMIMALPPVLPALSWEWARGETRAFARTALRVTELVGVAGAALVFAVGLSGASIIAVVVGDAAVNPAWLFLLVVTAMAVHGFSGPFAAAAQARGDIRPVIAFKLAVVAVLLASTAILWPLSLEEVGVALSAALILPSAVFCVAQLHRLLAMGGSAGLGWRIDAAVLVTAAGLGLAIQRIADLRDLWSALIGAAAVAVGVALVGIRMLRLGRISRRGLRNPA